jgi:hypothetical protein
VLEEASDSSGDESFDAADGFPFGLACGGAPNEGDLCTKTSFADRMSVERQIQLEGHDGWSSEKEFRIAR